MALRFISPADGHEWTNYNKGYTFIVANIIQQRVDDLIERWLEIVNNYMSHDWWCMTYESNCEDMNICCF